MKNNHLLLMNHPLIYWGFMVIVMMIVNYYFSQFITIQPARESFKMEETLEVVMKEEATQPSLLDLGQASEGITNIQENSLIGTHTYSSKSICQSKRTLLK